jgi:glycosyltransferase involved in cell wall biosynthesis
LIGIGKLPYVFRKIYNKIFGNRAWWIEFYCIWLSLFNKNITFHFIYAENIYKYIGYFKKKNKIICTFHQPVKQLVKNKSIKYWSNIDKIIVMSQYMKDELKSEINHKKIYYIPHGVNTDFFRPNYSIRDTKNILMVGNWMRDFKFAYEVIQKLQYLDREIKINIVTLRKNWNIFSNLSSIKLHDNITDEELLKLYQVSKLLYLPLIDYTVNNAILEAAACGCRILVSVKKGENKTYFPNDLISVIGKDIDENVNIIFKILNDENNFNIRLQDYTTKKYSWKIIAKKTKKCLKKDHL